MSRSKSRARRIERIKPMPVAQLKEQYLSKGIPVVIEDYVNNWPAAKKWTPDYLAETLGHKPVPVVTMRDGDYAHADINTMPLKKYLGLIGAIDEPVAEDHNTGSNVTHYLAQMPLAKYLPELVKDLETPPFFPDEDYGTTAVYVGGTLFSQLHYHQRGSATLCMLHGKKHVRLFPPDQSRYLYPHPWHSNLPHVSQTRHKEPDPEQFPDFSKAQYYETTVSAGEMLYIPIYWWHSIENEGFSISAVFFWYRSWASRFLPPAGVRSPYIYQSISKPFDVPKRVLQKVAKKVRGN